MELQNEYPDLVSTANDVLFAFRFFFCDVSFLAMTSVLTRFQHIPFRIRLRNY